LNQTGDINENKANNDNSKSNNVKVSNNSNQTQNWNSNDNQIKMQISKADEENNKDSKDNNNNNELNKKDNNQITIKIQSNFISANGNYVKHINTLASIRSKSKNGDTKDENNKHLNINKDHLQPLIHFTNLSSKKLKILGSNTKIKSDSDNK
jgi:hypothetical protein